MCTTASGTAPRLTDHDLLAHAYTEREVAASRVGVDRRAA